MSCNPDLKPLTGDSRINAIALILAVKHGMALPSEVVDEAYEDEDARKAAGLPEKGEPKFKSGDKVNFAGEPQIESVKSSCFDKTAWKYTIEDEEGHETTEVGETDLTAAEPEAPKE